jgi:catechol 2,3-dioxygenase-like lactoylglutathione lyase family enzyme
MGVQIPLLPSLPARRHPDSRTAGYWALLFSAKNCSEGRIEWLASGKAVLEYTGIRVRDLERSRRFYTVGLGLVAGRTGRMAAGGTWMELTDPESQAMLELNFYPDQPPYREGDELDHLGFVVPDLDDSIRRLTELGARVRIPPFREQDVRLAFLSDPDGVWIELTERVASDEPPTSQSVE